MMWCLIASLYAIFDYVFNLFMCMITGGFEGLRNKKRTRKPKRMVFFESGVERVNEFRSDILSWLWPITVLAMPIALYGITRYVITNTTNSLISIGINLDKYQILPYSYNIQILIWLAVVSASLTTIYRYRYQRSKPTFFSRSTIYSSIRVILFNIPIGYATLNIILTTVSFMVMFYRVLSDNSLSYNIFHPDQMYGFKISYNTIIGISFILLIISFLPTVILLREKNETYNKIYKLGIYSGIVLTFVSMGTLIYQFGERLESIQNVALQVDLLNQLNVNKNDIQTLTYLTYYSIVSSFPSRFPVPIWLSSLVSFRALVLGYELFRVFTSNTKELSIAEVFKFISSKL